jgi:alpha-aminoadipate/glutamate carrier protein LysW
VVTEYPEEREAMPKCPECSAEVGVDEGPQVNEIVQCPECGSELEVVSTAPVGLAAAPDVEEDWGE